MRILAIECDAPDAGGDGFTADWLRAEALCAWQLYQEGIVRELYFRADRTEAVILLECASGGDGQMRAGDEPGSCVRCARV